MTACWVRKLRKTLIFLQWNQIFQFSLSKLFFPIIYTEWKLRNPYMHIKLTVTLTIHITAKTNACKNGIHCNHLRVRPSMTFLPFFHFSSFTSTKYVWYSFFLLSNECTSALLNSARDGYMHSKYLSVKFFSFYYFRSLMPHTLPMQTECKRKKLKEEKLQ